MNRAFSWKDQSAMILEKCFKKSVLKHCYDENGNKDEYKYEYESEEDEDDDDDDDIKSADNKVFEMSLQARELALQQLMYSDIRIRRWRELTDILVSHQLPPRRTNCFVAPTQQETDRNGNSAALSRQRRALSEIESGKEETPVTPCRNDECKITFKFQYLIMTERLKVTVVKVSNLFHDSKEENDLAVGVEACLMPGKIQRQMTSLCKGTRDPVFNSVMYFKELSLEEMHRMCLRIRINGRDGTNGSVRILGEVSVSLDNFDIMCETVLEELINTRIGSRSGPDIVRTLFHTY